MPDILVREVPAEVLRALDLQAKNLGLSRADYLRRTLARQAATTQEGALSIKDLQQFAQQHEDLADESIMLQAWQ